MEEQSTITIVIAIIGVIIGSISLARQFWKERPRLNFEVKKASWDPLGDNYFALRHRISINTLLRNTGQSDTTIHRANITFSYKNKPYSVDSDIHNEILMQIGSAKFQFFHFDIHKDDIQLDDNIVNAKLIIEYTHGSKEKIIPIINKGK